MRPLRHEMRSQLSDRGHKWEQKRQLRAARLKAVRSLKQGDPHMTAAEIAERLAMPKSTVYSDLIELGLRTRLTPKQFEERRERVRAYRAEHPEMSLQAVANALGLARHVVLQACPAPERRMRLGYADARIAAVYDKLTATYVATPALLAKHARTALVTARSWLRRNHPECLINYRHVRAPVRTYKRRINGEVKTVRGFKRSFPKR
jgi:IclR helix-turn-helix domain